MLLILRCSRCANLLTRTDAKYTRIRIDVSSTHQVVVYLYACVCVCMCVLSPLLSHTAGMCGKVRTGFTLHRLVRCLISHSGTMLAHSYAYTHTHALTHTHTHTHTYLHTHAHTHVQMHTHASKFSFGPHYVAIVLHRLFVSDSNDTGGAHRTMLTSSLQYPLHVYVTGGKLAAVQEKNKIANDLAAAKTELLTRSGVSNAGAYATPSLW